MKKGIIKKIIVGTLIAAMTMGVMGCGAKKENAGLSNIKSKKKIVVGLSPDFAPFEFKDKQGNIIGMDAEIIKAVAKDIGVDYEIKSMDFNGLIPALQAGKLDIVVSGMNPTPEREKNILFSDGYYDSASQLVVKKGEADKYKAEKDVEGKTLAVQKASVQETQSKTLKAKEVKSLGKVTDCVLTLQGGKVDAVLLDKPVAMLTVKANADLELTDLVMKDTSTKAFAVAMKKGETDLQSSINKTIAKLKSEGKLDQFFDDAVKQAE